MTDNIFVFDRNLVRQKRNRSAPHLKEHGFLIDWGMEQISNRLKDIKRKYPLALQIGCRTDKLNKNDFGIEKLIKLDIAENLLPDIQANEELLPFRDNSFDLVTSPLNLHSTNDLPGTLLQINRILKPDGLFIAAMLGGETLYEARDIMQNAEMVLSGGTSPRIAPFADMQQMGALMQRAGFNLPVVDSEKVTVTYDHPFKLFNDLRFMGETNTLLMRRKNFSSRKYFQEVAKEYQKKYSDGDKIKATFDVIFLIGWAPHESQQKPLQPGSAQNRLSEALNTQEEKLPC